MKNSGLSSNIHSASIASEGAVTPIDNSKLTRDGEVAKGQEQRDNSTSKRAETSPGAADTSAFAPAPHESPNAFAAFLVYLKLPGKRRLTSVAQKTGAGLRTVIRWAGEFDWAGRVNQYQARILQQRAQVESDLQCSEIIDWADRSTTLREREWEITDSLLLAIQRRLSSGDLDEAALATIARTLALTSKIGRLAAGLTSGPIEESNSSDPLEQEFETALQNAYSNRLPLNANELAPLTTTVVNQ